MSDANPKPLRPWTVIADELANEKDTERVLELSHELNEALRQQKPMSTETAVPASAPPAKNSAA